MSQAPFFDVGVLRWVGNDPTNQSNSVPLLDATANRGSENQFKSPTGMVERADSFKNRAAFIIRVRIGVIQKGILREIFWRDLFPLR